MSQSARPRRDVDGRSPPGARRGFSLRSAELSASLEALHGFFDLPEDQPLYFSAVTRQGRDELWREVNDLLFGADEEDVEWVLEEEEAVEVEEPPDEGAPLDDGFLVF